MQTKEPSSHIDPIRLVEIELEDIEVNIYEKELGE